MYSVDIGLQRYIDLKIESNKADLFKLPLLWQLCEHPGGLQKSILEDPEAAMSMSELNVAYRMSVDEYQELQRDVHGKRMMLWAN